MRGLALHRAARQSTQQFSSWRHYESLRESNAPSARDIRFSCHPTSRAAVFSNFRLKQKIWIITGCSLKLGRAIADGVRQRGDIVVAMKGSASSIRRAARLRKGKTSCGEKFIRRPYS